MTSAEPVGTVAVIGAGVMGWAIAAELADRGIATHVVAADGITTLTDVSAASFAWVNAEGKTPPWYRELNLEGQRWHHRHGASWFVPTGAVVNGALRPDDGYVDVGRFVADRSARHAPAGSVIESRVDRLSLEPTGIRLEGTGRADHGSPDLVVDTVIVAAGAATSALIGTAIDAVPDRLSTTRGPRGFGARVRVPHGAVTGIAVDRGLLVRPAGVDTAWVQSVALEERYADRCAEHWTRDVFAETIRHELAEIAGIDVGPEAVLSVASAVRPVPSDGLPVVGWVRPGLYAAVSHSGITLAPLLASRVAQHIVGDADSALNSGWIS